MQHQVLPKALLKICSHSECESQGSLAFRAAFFSNDRQPGIPQTPGSVRPGASAARLLMPSVGVAATRPGDDVEEVCVTLGSSRPMNDFMDTVTEG